MSFKLELKYMLTKKVVNPCEEIPPYLFFVYYYSDTEYLK